VKPISSRAADKVVDFAVLYPIYEAKTACLTDALLRHSGFAVPQMVELNRLVQTLRRGMRDATDEPLETGEHEARS
jgi:hypothetical protein